jgi:hypothetical protein
MDRRCVLNALRALRVPCDFQILAEICERETGERFVRVYPVPSGHHVPHGRT